MVKRTKLIVSDDIDGSPAHETINFALNGEEFEIDLTREHAAELEAMFGVWIARARHIKGTRRHESVVPGTPRAMREWANSRGIHCPAKGRIPATVKEQYLAEYGLDPEQH